MSVVKKLSMIFLAVYLIVSAVTSMAGIMLGSASSNLLQLVALVSGVLILISIGTCGSSCSSKSSKQ